MINKMTDEEIIAMLRLPEDRNFLVKLISRQHGEARFTNTANDLASSMLLNNKPDDAECMMIIINNDDTADVFVSAVTDDGTHVVGKIQKTFNLPEDVAKILSMYIHDNFWYYCVFINDSNAFKIVSLQECVVD